MESPFAGIPYQEHYTKEELLKIFGDLRTGMKEFAKTLGLPPLVGKEITVVLPSGPLHMLGYNLQATGMLPAMIDLHGGGFTICDASMDDPYMEQLAVKAGVRIFNVDYFLAPEHPFPEAIYQLAELLRYLRDNATQFGIDPERIGIMGHSAGGNLVGALGILQSRGEDLGIRCCLMDYPPMNIGIPCEEKGKNVPIDRLVESKLYNEAYLPDLSMASDPLASPVNASIADLKNFPKAMIITATEDLLRKEAEAFGHKLQMIGCDCQMRLFEGEHGFTHFPSEEATQAWNVMAEFIQEAIV